MTDLRSKFKPPFRRTSSSSSVKPDFLNLSKRTPRSPVERDSNRGSLKLSKNKKDPRTSIKLAEKQLPSLPQEEAQSRNFPVGREAQLPGIDASPDTAKAEQINPQFIVDQASPDLAASPHPKRDSKNNPEDPSRLGETDARVNASSRPNIAARRHSPISFDRTDLFPFHRIDDSPSRIPDRSSLSRRRTPGYSSMLGRKIWVKRPGSTATQVTISEDDLVDDVKDMILRKYANSLGRNFDPPDVVLKVVVGPQSSRHTNERALAPDENISKILDLHYPGGQSIDEALVIDVPQRRTPKHSPRVNVPYYYSDDVRPAETGTDYFPPMPVVSTQSPHLPSNVSAISGHGGVTRPSLNPHPHTHSIAVLETGHVPNLPSPGSIVRQRHSDRPSRPRYGRQHTSSPTVIAGTSHQSVQDVHKVVANPHAVSSPPVPSESLPKRAATPPPRNQSPRPNQKAKRSKKNTMNAENPSTPGVLGGSVPPINVLIVEDNIINLRLLEAFLKRLNVRWSTAMNGEIAVNKWRQGGFHLVLMDIQLPVMNGLDATKEIRRLERVNKIGVFSSRASEIASAEQTPDGSTDRRLDSEEKSPKPKQEDDLKNLSLFKSPVIIVALTASSLQSDRHEALAAGCNDFLTKPVNFDWLSRKVMEWGCMQALIDFDGWRKWKDFTKTSPIDIKKSTTGVPSKSPQSPLMNGKQKKFLGIMDGGNSSSEDQGDKSDEGNKAGV